MQSNENQNIPCPNTRRQNRCRVNKENHDWKEDYITISLLKQHWKKVKVETEKVNKLLQNISTDITKLNELIHAQPKLSCDKIWVPQKNPNRNTKPEWEIRLEGWVKNM